MASSTPADTAFAPKTVDKYKNPLIQRGKVAIKSFVFGSWLPRLYRKAARTPVVADRVLFVELSRAELSHSLQPMWNHVRDVYGLDCQFVSLGSFRMSMPAYFLNCISFMRDLAQARYVFICESIEAISCVDLRPETEVVNLWHGPGAFKRFGFSTAEKIFGGDLAEKKRFPQSRNNSLVCISSPEVKWAYIEGLGLEDTPDIVQPLGTARTDVFFDKEFLARARTNVEQRVPQAKGRKVVLYAPTFRGRVSFATGPDKLDLPALKNALADEYVLLIKHHPHVKKRPAIPEDCADFAFDVGEDMPIDELLSAADVCITDYSSLAFEYSLFDRPMAFFAYDLEDFDDWRGFYYPYEEFAPGPIVRTSEEVVDFLVHAGERYDAQRMQAFRDKFMSACDGHATERIARTVLGAPDSH